MRKTDVLKTSTFQVWIIWIQVSFCWALTHADIINFLNFLLQHKNQRAGENGVKPFPIYEFFLRFFIFNIILLLFYVKRCYWTLLMIKKKISSHGFIVIYECYIILRSSLPRACRSSNWANIWQIFLGRQVNWFLLWHTFIELPNVKVTFLKKWSHL